MLDINRSRKEQSISCEQERLAEQQTDYFSYLLKQTVFIFYLDF